MRFISSMILCASALAFVGCGKNSSSPATNNPYTLDDYGPSTKPAGAASNESLKGLLQMMKGANALLPGQDTYHQVVSDGTDLREVTDSSPERQKALKKLSPEGLQVLASMKANCQIHDAQATQNGNPDSVTGATLTKTASMSTSGAACPILENVRNSTTTHYDRVDVNQQTQDFVIQESTQQVSEAHSKIQDPRLASRIGMAQIDLVLNTNLKLETSQTAGVQTTNAKLVGEGQIQLALADGGQINFKIKMQVLAKGNEQATQILLDGQTPEGAVRIVVIMGKDSQIQLLTVNGQKADPADFRGLIGDDN